MKNENFYDVQRLFSPLKILYSHTHILIWVLFHFLAECSSEEDMQNTEQYLHHVIHTPALELQGALIQKKV